VYDIKNQRRVKGVYMTPKEENKGIEKIFGEIRLKIWDEILIEMKILNCSLQMEMGLNTSPL